MSIDKSIDHLEKAFGSGSEARFAAARKVSDIDRNPAYTEVFPSVPQPEPAEHFGSLTSVANYNESANGVDEIANRTDTRSRTPAPSARSGESESVAHNSRMHTEALRRAESRNR